MIRAAVFQIIARDSRDYHVLQPHSPDGFRDALRFVFFECKRLGCCHRAKSAGACATFARNHHRRCPLTPAFPTVRTLRAFTNGMQAQIGDERFRRKENRVRGQPDFDPGRLLRLVQGGIDFGARHRVGN